MFVKVLWVVLAFFVAGSAYSLYQRFKTVVSLYKQLSPEGRKEWGGPL